MLFQRFSTGDTRSAPACLFSSLYDSDNSLSAYRLTAWQDRSEPISAVICGQWTENGKSIDKYALICCPLYTPLNCNVTCYFSLSLLLLCINVHQMQMSHKTWFISIGAISLYFQVCRLNSLLTNEQMVLAERTIWDVKPSLIISSGLVWFFKRDFEQRSYCTLWHQVMKSQVKMPALTGATFQAQKQREKAAAGNRAQQKFWECSPWRIWGGNSCKCPPAKRNNSHFRISKTRCQKSSPWLTVALHLKQGLIKKKHVQNANHILKILKTTSKFATCPQKNEVYSLSRCVLALLADKLASDSLITCNPD